MKARLVRAMNIKDVVKDEKWQRIRKSLIGKWKNSHKENVKILTYYLMWNWDNPIAIRRLVNVLTGSVHRVGHTKGQKETDDLRYKVRKRWAEMLNESTENIRGEI